MKSKTTMCHLFLLVMLFSSIQRVISMSHFRPCSKGLPCDYMDNETKKKIPAVYPKFQMSTGRGPCVQIECINFPDWSEFLLGATLFLGEKPNLKFINCVMPGENFNIVERLGIKGVENLVLEQNRGGISKADLDVFPHLKNLSFVDTPMGKGVGVVPFDLLYGLQELRNLNLNGAGLHLRNEGLFKKSQYLVSLNIENNNLSYLPGKMFYDLVNLEVIKFGFNRFNKLPDDLFSRNSRLKVVDLRHNQYFNITRLPDGFLSGLPNLQNVSLNKIGLNKVPQNLLWGSNNILELNLCDNNLTILPADFLKDARMLMKLDLSRNHLTVIDKNFFINLQQLQELNLEHNNLKFIEYDALSSLIELKTAKFSHNQLDLYTRENNEKSPFYNCNHLEELYLSHNNITQIFSDWVAFSRLQKLDLAYNSLDFLATTQLEFASNELQVNLTHNKISLIDLYGLEYYAAKYNDSRNVAVDLNSNPIYCDCDLYSFLRYIDGAMEQTAYNFITLKVQQLTCDGPEQYRDLKLLEFTKMTELTCALKSYYYNPTDLFQNEDDDYYMTLSETGKVFVIVCIVFSFFVVVAAVCYFNLVKYSKHIKIYLYSRNLCSEKSVREKRDQEKLGRTETHK